MNKAVVVVVVVVVIDVVKLYKFITARQACWRTRTKVPSSAGNYNTDYLFMQKVLPKKFFLSPRTWPFCLVAEKPAITVILLNVEH